MVCVYVVAVSESFVKSCDALQYQPSVHEAEMGDFLRLIARGLRKLGMGLDETEKQKCRL
jgi:hypothetical protein